MPLILAKREDVAPKDRPVPEDRSGLNETDWKLIAVDLAMREAHFTARDAEAIAGKLARLDSLLDDPALAATHPTDDPDRLKAVTRHGELFYARKRLIADFARAAKATATAWEALPSAAMRDAFRDGLLATWSDSPAFALAIVDPKVAALGFWRTVLTMWRQPELAGVDDVPF